MMSALTAATDDALLDLAGHVLTAADYEVQVEPTPHGLVLLAENSDNVLAVACSISAHALVEFESTVSRVLSQRLTMATPSAKRWDAYTVLLTSASLHDEESHSLTQLTQNLRHLRRIVRVGISPTIAGVERALRPLLPPPPFVEAGNLPDSLDLMAEALSHAGMDDFELQELLVSARHGSWSDQSPDDEDGEILG